MRILFVAFLVFIDDPKGAAGCMGMLSVVWLLIQVYTTPYIDSSLDFLQTCLAVGLVVVSFSGMMFSIKPLSPSFRRMTEYIQHGMVCMMGIATALVAFKEVIIKIRISVSTPIAASMHYESSVPGKHIIGFSTTQWS